jgi:hypothetical protein
MNHDPKSKPKTAEEVQQALDNLEIMKRLVRYGSPGKLDDQPDNSKPDTRHTLESDDADQGYLFDDDDVA